MRMTIFMQLLFNWKSNTPTSTPCICRDVFFSVRTNPSISWQIHLFVFRWVSHKPTMSQFKEFIIHFPIFCFNYLKIPTTNKNFVVTFRIWLAYMLIVFFNNTSFLVFEVRNSFKDASKICVLHEIGLTRCRHCYTL